MDNARFEGHVPGQGQPLWNQSFYFNAYDPKTRAGVLIRIGLLEHSDQSNSWLIAFKDGLPLFTRTNLRLPYTPRRPAGGMEIAGMHVDVLEPLRKARIHFEEKDFSFDLTWTAIHDVADSLAMSKGDNSAFAEEIADIHLEGPCRVVGSITARGEKTEVNGTGIRDIAAGVRNWDGLLHYRLAWPIFENGMTFCGIRGVGTSGASAYMRMFNDGEKWLRVPEMVDDNTYEADDPFAVRMMNWSFTDEKGVKRSFTGKPLFHWLFPQDGFVICEQIMEYKLDDGTIGYGLGEGGFRLPWRGLK